VTKKLPANKSKKKKNRTAKGTKKTIQKEPNNLTPLPLTKNTAVDLSEEQILANKSIFLLKYEEEIKMQAKAKLTADDFFLSKILDTDLKLISQTLYYYFWQVIMPINVIPVRGHDFPDPGLPEIVHIIFLLILFSLLFKDVGFFYLISAHIMILPFLGIIPAPYMNLTWVSDQHLYLALPLFVAFWLRLVEKLKSKYSFILPSALLIVFAWKSFQSVPHYRNQNAFFEASLAYNPYNIPVAYNLAVARVVNGDWKEGYEVLTKIVHFSESEPWIKENLYFPYAMTLYLKLKIVLDQNAN
jgi:hypothetical protein